MAIERPMFPPRAESIHAFPVQPVVDHPQFSSLLRRLSEREVTPRDVLIELFEEELLQYPDLLADLVIARLGVKGFEIVPANTTSGTHHG